MTEFYERPSRDLTFPLSDPGSFVKRRHDIGPERDETEPLVWWQARAVLAAGWTPGSAKPDRSPSGEEPGSLPGATARGGAHATTPGTVLPIEQAADLAARTRTAIGRCVAALGHEYDEPCASREVEEQRYADDRARIDSDLAGLRIMEGDSPRYDLRDEDRDELRALFSDGLVRTAARHDVVPLPQSVTDQ